MLTYALVKEMLRYDATSGRLYWLERPSHHFATEIESRRWNNRLAGKEALTAINGHGYRHGTVCKVSIKAHRIIWLLVYGCFPNGVVDHIDQNKLNNRIENLRDVSKVVNSLNAKVYKNNRSGVTGVSWDKRTSRWKARGMVRGKDVTIGRFDTKEEACAARELHFIRQTTAELAGRRYTPPKPRGRISCHTCGRFVRADSSCGCYAQLAEG